jgi:hypothetical protein
MQIVAEARHHHHHHGCVVASEITKGATGPVHLRHYLGYDGAHPQVDPVLGKVANQLLQKTYSFFFNKQRVSSWVQHE